jgi:hypothetical protein
MMAFSLNLLSAKANQAASLAAQKLLLQLLGVTMSRHSRDHRCCKKKKTTEKMAINGDDS